MLAKETQKPKSGFIVVQKVIRVMNAKKWESYKNAGKFVGKRNHVSTVLVCNIVHHQHTRVKELVKCAGGNTHTSTGGKSKNIMLATENLLIHPVVVLKIKNVTCRALLDTGTVSSYVSASGNQFRKRPRTMTWWWL